MTGSLRYFVIRSGNYLELRTSHSPPKALVSRLIKTVTKLKQSWDLYRVPAVCKMVPYEGQMVLRQVFYLGGRVVGVVKCSSATRKLLGRLDPNGIKEISKDTKVALLKVKYVQRRRRYPRW